MHKLQHCLGERGKGGKIRQIVLIVLRILSSIVALDLEEFAGGEKDCTKFTPFITKEMLEITA